MYTQENNINLIGDTGLASMGSLYVLNQTFLLNQTHLLHLPNSFGKCYLFQHASNASLAASGAGLKEAKYELKATHG